MATSHQPQRSVHAEMREHALAAKKAAEFFTLLAKSSEAPITPENFTERIEQFFARLDELQGASNALVLSALKDEPCPQSLFAAWASTARIWQWRNAAKNPLPTEELNGKICVRPSDFFRALREHGKTA